MSNEDTLPLVGKDTKEELPDLGMQCEIKNLWEGKQKCTVRNHIADYVMSVTLTLTFLPVLRKLG